MPESDEDPTPDPETPPEAPPAPAASDDEPLGEPGKAALKAERARAAKAEKELKKLRDEAAAREAEAMSESEKAIAAAKAEGVSEATAAANRRIVRSEVKALAAKKLNDPADAVAMLDLDQFEVDGDGEVDEEAITAALDALVAAKPYLAASPRPGGAGDADAGARTPPPGAGTLDDQIKDAEKAGDMALARKLKTSMLMSQG